MPKNAVFPLDIFKSFNIKHLAQLVLGGWTHIFGFYSGFLEVLPVFLEGLLMVED